MTQVGEFFLYYDMNNYEYKENMVFVVTSNGGPILTFNLLPG